MMCQSELSGCRCWGPKVWVFVFRPLPPYQHDLRGAMALSSGPDPMRGKNHDFDDL